LKFDKKKLRITLASFEDAFDLQDAVANALKGNNVDIPEDKDAQINVSSFLDAALSTIASKPVRDALFKCAETALYGEEKIDQEFFGKIENRELYYPIMVEILKENIGPFIKGLLSLFGDFGKKAGELLKQK